MSNGRCMLYGGGGHCKVVKEILRLRGVEISEIIDDNPSGKGFEGVPMRAVSLTEDPAIITIGNCGIRRKIAERLIPRKFAVAIHPTAIIASDVEIGEGTVVCAGAVVNPGVSIGKHCIINTRSVVEHDDKIGDFVHIATGAVLCGGVEVGEGSWIGAGAVVRQGIRIGRDTMIGAGSVVVKDIPDGVTAYGNPCRVRE